MKKQLLILLFAAVCGSTHAQTNADTKNTVKENPVLIGQGRGFTITKAKLSTDPVLRMPEANKDYHITGYSISYLPAGNGRDVLGPYEVQGDKMNTGRAADILAKAQPGDRIFFDIIAVSDIAGREPLKLAAAIKIIAQ